MRTDGGLAAEHDCIGAVEDLHDGTQSAKRLSLDCDDLTHRVEDVVGLGSGRPGLRYHALEHLRGDDDGPPLAVTLGHDLLLGDRDLRPVRRTDEDSEDGRGAGAADGGISTPRSPRATMMASLSAMISSMFLTAVGRSILLMTLIFLLPNPSRQRRTFRTSSAFPKDADQLLFLVRRRRAWACL